MCFGMKNTLKSNCYHTFKQDCQKGFFDMTRNIQYKLES